MFVIGTESDHICTVVNLPAHECAAMGMVWSTYLEKFVVTLDCGTQKGSSFQMALSDDLVHLRWVLKENSLAYQGTLERTI